MKIRWTKDVEIEVVDYIMATDEEIKENESFKAGEETEFDILGELEANGKPAVNVQFGDGSCCYGLYKDCFEIIEA